MSDEIDDQDTGLSDENMDFMVARFQESFGMVLTAAFESTRDRDACSEEEADDVQRAAVVALVLTLIVQCEIGRRPEVGPLNQCVLELVTDILEQHGPAIEAKIKDLNEGVGEIVH